MGEADLGDIGSGDRDLEAGEEFQTPTQRRWQARTLQTYRSIRAGVEWDHRMAKVKVYIVGKDRKVGAMVKALAREIAGFQPVRGATKEFLSVHGYYLFDFASASRGAEFRDAVRKYLPTSLATIQE